MASATVTNQTPLLKRIWGPDVSTPMLKASQVLNQCKKDTKFYGEGKYIVFKVAPIAGGSATFSEALVAQAPSIPVRMFLQHRKEYQVWTIQNDLIERSKGNTGAVLEAVKSELDSARYAHARAMARRANGKAAVGQLATTTNLATNQFTFRDDVNVIGLEPGAVIVFSLDDGTGISPLGLLPSTATPEKKKVSAISNRTVTVTNLDGSATTLNTVPGLTTAGFVHRSGDYAVAMVGLMDYLPETAPAPGGSFLGLDRGATYTDRVAGYRVSGSNQPKLQTLEDAAAEGALRNLTGDFVLVANPMTIRDIRKELASDVIISNVGDAKTGFKAIQILLQSGTCTLLSEPDAPTTSSRMMDAKKFVLRSTDTVPKDITNNNGQLLTDYQDDAKQGRIGAYGNFELSDPGECIVINW
jgi:hypothetical protein